MRRIILCLFIILLCFTLGITQEKELSEEEKAILKKAIEIIKKHEERELLELMRESSEPKEKELSWEEKYRMYPSTKYWLDSLYESYGGGKTEAKKLEEENDRLEDLLEELRSERSSLEWDMMEYRWDLEFAKPNPLDYKMALDLAISSTMMDIELGLYPWLTTPSYPRYSTQQDWTNYLWLYLLLNKK